MRPQPQLQQIEPKGQVERLHLLLLHRERFVLFVVAASVAVVVVVVSVVVIVVFVQFVESPIFRVSYSLLPSTDE